MKAKEETLGESKKQTKGFRINIRNTELLEGRQDKEMRNYGEKRMAQPTALVHLMNSLSQQNQPEKEKKK